MNNTQQKTQQLAYQMWESEGKPHNQAVRHWETACKIIAAENATHEPATMAALHKSPIAVQTEITPKPKTRKSKTVPADETLLAMTPKTAKKSLKKTK